MKFADEIYLFLPPGLGLLLPGCSARSLFTSVLEVPFLKALIETAGLELVT